MGKGLALEFIESRLRNGVFACGGNESVARRDNPVPGEAESLLESIV